MELLGDLGNGEAFVVQLVDLEGDKLCADGGKFYSEFFGEGAAGVVGAFGWGNVVEGVKGLHRRRGVGLTPIFSE
jgi:hypothetical protein